MIDDIAQFYLDELTALPQHQQLVIKVGGGLLEDQDEMTALKNAITNLVQASVKLIIIHGGGLQLTQKLQTNGVESKFINGKRVTDEKTIAIAESTFNELSISLKQLLDSNEISTCVEPGSSLFIAKKSTDLGFVGEKIIGVNRSKIIEIMKNCDVLIVNSLAVSEDDNTLNVNADTIFKALAAYLKPHRMLSLTPTGGILSNVDDLNSVIPGIDIKDIDQMVADEVVNEGMAIKVRELASTLAELPTGSAVSITKPSKMLDELLTIRGAGTYVGKGPMISTYTTFDQFKPAISDLITDVFEKKLPNNYFAQKIDRLYITRDRKALAILLRLEDNTPYLDKFAVQKTQRGRGIGEHLWHEVVQDYPVLVWRSHAKNNYATWYEKHANVSFLHGEWIIFGRGISEKSLKLLADEIVTIPAMIS